MKHYLRRVMAAVRPLSLVTLLLMLVTNAWAQSLSDPLCIESLGPDNLSRTLSFTNGLKNNGAESDLSLEYKHVDADGTVLEDWTPMVFTAASSSTSAAMVKNFDIKKGQKVYVRAASENATTRGFKIHTATSNISYWKAKVSGNIMTLLKADGTVTEVPEYGFQEFFMALPLVDASQLQLPATTVGRYGYAGMFYCNNNSFAQGPASIAATTVGDHACYQMFNRSGFEVAPQMNVTTVAPYCFSEMFYYNTSLTTAPELPATELADYCYDGMFKNCTSLLAPPTLPATTMAPYAYRNMFQGCESMTSAPELPAQTLADYCYNNMFYGCKAMKGGITLPAADLVRGCYDAMLRDCSGLESVEVAFTSWTNGQNQLTGWLAGTASGCNLICSQALEDALPANRGANNLPTWMCINGKFPLKVTYDTHPVAYEMKTMAQAMIVPEGIDVFLPALAVGVFGRETATVYPCKPLAAGEVVPANTPFLVRAVNPNAPSSGSGTFTFLVTDQPATANATTQGHPAGADYALYGQLTGEGTPTSSGTPYRVWVKRGVNEDPYLEWDYTNHVYSADPGYTCVVTLKENYAANAAAYPNTLVMVFDDVLLAEYKTEQVAYVADNFPQADDCAACTQLIADAKEAIAAVAYSKAETLAENKARVDAIVNKLKADLWNQRKSELAAYQTAKVAEVEALRLPADRWGAQGLITTAKEDIAAVEFDATPVPDTKTVTYHKELVDAIVTLLTATDLPNQRAFEAEEDRVIAEVVDVKKEADDCDVCTGLINKCKEDILALAYDKAITRDANFARITPLTTQLYADLVTQRTSELNAYKTTQSAAAAALAEAEDAQDCPAIITAAQQAIAAILYTDTQTLKVQKEAVDAVLAPLPADLLAERTLRFNEYKAVTKANAQAKAETDDCATCTGLIAGAQADIDALAYDAEKLFVENKAAQDAIVETMKADLIAQRTSELNAYKTAQSDAAAAMAEAVDAQGCPALIAAAQEAIAAVTYTAAETLKAQQKAVDDILAPLPAALLAERTLRFNEYKDVTKAGADAKAEADDCATCTGIITDAKAAIEALAYDAEKLFVENKAAQDALVETMKADLVAQRTSELDAYKTAQSAAAAAMAEAVDAQGCPAIITAAQQAVAAVAYTDAKTLKAQQDAVDALLTQLSADLLAERTLRFNEYKATTQANADAEAETEDSSACTGIITDAKAAIEALTYNAEKLFVENKAAQDALVETMKADLIVQRTTDLDSYKTAQSAAAAAMAEAEDCDVCTGLISGVKASIAAVTYTTAKTVAAQKAEVDDLLAPLAEALATQRTSELNAYKAAQSAAAAALAEAEDAEGCPAIIITAQEAIDAVSYTAAKTLKAQKTVVDDILAQLPADLLAKRTERFDEYKATTTALAEAKAETDDCAQCSTLIADATAAIEALGYDADKLFVANKAAQDALVASLATALATQRENEVEDYKTAVLADADDLAEAEDAEASTQLIADAKEAIRAIHYTTDKTVAAQKAEVDAVFAPLAAQLLAVRKAAFEAYKATAKAAVDALGNEHDAAEARAVATAAKQAITEATYAETLTLSANLDALDAIVEQAAIDYTAALMPAIALNTEGLATYSCKFDVEILTEGITAYKAAVVGERIVLTPLEGYIPAGTGILLRGEVPGTVVTFAQATGVLAADVAGNELKATTQADGSLAPLEANSWALSTDNLFLHYIGEEYIHNRAYLVHIRPAGARGMSMVFEDDATGIHRTTGDAASPAGIYYQNGQFFILRGGQKIGVDGQEIK